MPLTFSLRHAYLASETENSMIRASHDLYIVTGTSTDQHENRQEDCSSRSLATLLVAWVSAAMVASVLLRWKYMWMALAILTLLFLLACMCGSCISRRNAEQIMAREESRFAERRMDIQSVSGGMDLNYPHRVTEPPAYQTYWIGADLPPSYSVVIGSETSSAPPEPNSPSEDDLRVDNGPRLSNPPPYSVAIQANHTSIQTTSDHHQADHGNMAVLPISLSRDLSSPTPINRNEDKDEADGSKAGQNVLSTSTQYLSNFISQTFGRGHRSRNTSTSIRDTQIVCIPAINQEPSSSSPRTVQINNS